MSTVLTQSYRRQRDHFEPQDLDPQEQRRLRGQLEQIDYAAFVSNREVISQTLSKQADEATALDILRYAREHLQPYQRVRRVEFAELPKTISGKIRRVELRQREERVAAGQERAQEWRDDALRDGARGVD